MTEGARRRRATRRARLHCPVRQLLAITLAVALLAMLPACEGPYYRSFADAGQMRDRTLIRQARLVADSCESIEKQVATSVANLKAEAANPTAKDTATAFERELHRCESRAKVAADRLATFEFSGQTAFDRWELELGEYKDKALRDASKKALEDVRSRHKNTTEQLKRSNDRLQPFLYLLADQSRLLRQTSDAHSRAAVDLRLDQLEEKGTDAQAAMRVGRSSAADFADWMDARREPARP